MSVFEELKEVENHFFTLDKNTDIATIHLQYDKASDLFDPHYVSNKPVLNSDFMSTLQETFDMIPSGYQLDLDVQIQDYEGYTAEDLQSIFHDNILLEYKAKHRTAKRKNKLAFFLIGAGILFFIIMITAGRFWPEGGLVHDIFFYISDIAATVTIWEALGILLVEERENRLYRRSLISRFRKIRFYRE